MTVVAELTAELPWGVLLVTDLGSNEQIPEWRSPEEQVTSAASALAVRVRHGDEGPVSVRVWSQAGDITGTALFEGSIRVDSGVLRVSDAVGEQTTDAEVSAGSHTVTIFVDEPAEATLVDLVVT